MVDTLSYLLPAGAHAGIRFVETITAKEARKKPFPLRKTPRLSK